MTSRRASQKYRPSMETLDLRIAPTVFLPPPPSGSSGGGTTTPPPPPPQYCTTTTTA